MSDDARFEDGGETSLNLGALEAEDVKILSALAQDSVFPASEMRYQKTEQRFALLLNRFRWEDTARGNRPPERVQSVLLISNVQKVASSGVPRGDGDTILSLLSVKFAETDAPSGQITLTLAGDGAIRLDVEALDVTLKDVTRPYLAPSKKTPDHGA